MSKQSKPVACGSSTTCEWCGERTDGTDHNADCPLETVADVLDEFGSDDEENTRTRDFRWAEVVLSALNTQHGVNARKRGDYTQAVADDATRALDDLSCIEVYAGYCADQSKDNDARNRFHRIAAMARDARTAADAKAGALRGWGWTEYVPPFSPPIQGNNDGVVRDADGTTICDTYGHEGNAALIAFALNELARTAPDFEATGQEGDKGL